MIISVIVPVLNEEASLPAFLNCCEQWDCVDEVIFTDGGSSDSTCEILAKHRLVTGARGRGAQCMLGARHARGDALVFVHADSFVPPESMRAIRTALEAGTAWGCLTLRFDDRSLALRIGALMSNARVRFTGIAFGDQTMFMTRELFDRVDGMPEIALMEDYELSRRLRAIAWPKQLPETVSTSARRFHGRGIIKTMLQMRHLRHLYRKGVDAESLARIYRDSDGK